MSLTWSAAVGAGEPDERDAAALGVPDLLAELLRRSRPPRWGCRGARSAVGDRVAGRRGAPRRRARPARRSAPARLPVEHAVGEQRDQRARDAEARCRRRGTSSGRRWPARRTGRRQPTDFEPLVAGHEDLEDGAGVVVEAAGDAQVGLDGRRASPTDVGAAVDAPRPARRALVEQLVARRPSARTRSTNEVSATRIVGQLEAALRPAPAVAPASLDEQRRRRPRRGSLSSLSIGPDRGGDVGDAEAAVEALDQLAVVDLEATARGSGSAPSASAITRTTSTSWWNGSSSRPTMSMSAWVNWR